MSLSNEVSFLSQIASNPRNDLNLGDDEILQHH